MNQKQRRGSTRRKDRTLKFVAAGFAAVLVAGALLGTIGNGRMTAATTEGLAYLQKLESQDTGAVETKLREQRAARLRAESEQRKKELLNGSIDVWSLFGESVILGDSRAVGFFTNEFLPESRVLAGGGDTIRLISEHMDELKNLKPENVFLCYGLNDVSIGYWPTKEEYVAEYKEILAKLQTMLPDTKIYVNSILPAQPVAIQMEGSWSKIPDYSKAVREMCEKEGYGWVDCDELIEKNQDMYDVDGIHVRKEFYPLWGTQMMMAVYDASLNQEEKASDGETAETEDAEVLTESVSSSSL